MHVIILDESFQARKDGEDEPYFFDTTPVCPCIGFGTYSQEALSKWKLKLKNWVSHRGFFQLHCFPYVHFLLLVFWDFLGLFFFFLPLSFLIPEYLFTIVNLHVYFFFLMPVLIFTVNCIFFNFLTFNFLVLSFFIFYSVHSYLDTYAYTLIPVFTQISFLWFMSLTWRKNPSTSTHTYTCTFLPV